jgi:molecular chaperone GrpE
MSMAASLIERAKEVAATGIVDDAFSSSFVPELEAELKALADGAAAADSNAMALEASLLSNRDKFVRLSADFDNFRKRTAGEKEAARAAAKGDALAALLPVIDAFEAAKSQLKLEGEAEKKVDASYQALYRQMVEALRAQGLEAVPGAGSPFDPEVHEAIMREPSEDVPDGTVLEEFRKGFKLGEKLLRPAMVKVSFSEAPAASGDGGEEEDAA